LVDTLLQDLRYGGRMLRRSPTFSCIAIATIALATAAIATVTSLADTLLWRHLRAADAATLVSVSATRGRPTEGVVSYPDYASFRDRATTVSGLAAHYSTAPLFVAVGATAKEVNGAVVSANYFPLLGLQPALGRFFHADEDRVPDRDRVAVLGYDFWRTWFAADPSAVGSALTVNGVPFTIVGVAPANPVALTPLPVNVYIPTMMLRVGYRWCKDSLASDCNTLGMVGRLAGGRSVAEAAARFASRAACPRTTRSRAWWRRSAPSRSCCWWCAAPTSAACSVRSRRRGRTSSRSACRSARGRCGSSAR